MTTTALLVALVAFGIAGIVGVRGRRRHRSHALVTDTDLTDVAAIDGDGLVKLTGTVRADDTVPSPIRETPCVCAAWEVEEADGTDWHSRAAGITTTAFVLDDGTGEVVVDLGDHVRGENDVAVDVQLGPVDLERAVASGVTVGDVSCTFDRFDPALEVDAGERPPEHVVDFLAATDGLSTDGPVAEHLGLGEGHATRRYFDGAVEPGDEVTLLATARTSGDGTDAPATGDVVVGPGDGDPVLLSTAGEAGLVADLAQYRLLYGVAAALGAVGAVALAVGVA
jgi:hypothetical protein